jgi:hypothetical protein
VNPLFTASGLIILKVRCATRFAPYPGFGSFQL